MVLSAQKLQRWRSDQDIAKLARKILASIVAFFVLAMTLNAYFESGLLPFYDFCMNVQSNGGFVIFGAATILIMSFICAIYYDTCCYLTIRKWKTNRVHLISSVQNKEERHLLNEPLMRSSILIAIFLLPTFLAAPLF